MRLIKWLYAPVLRFTMNHKLAVVGATVGLLAVTFGMIAPNLGSEFVPRLSEGALAVGVVRLAGTDLEESIRVNTQMEKAVLAAFPDEVQHVWSRIGTAEVARAEMVSQIKEELRSEMGLLPVSLLRERSALIEQVTRQEEERFRATLKRGLERLSNAAFTPGNAGGRVDAPSWGGHIYAVSATLEPCTHRSSRLISQNKRHRAAG